MEEAYWKHLGNIWEESERHLIEEAYWRHLGDICEASRMHLHLGVIKEDALWGAVMEEASWRGHQRGYTRGKVSRRKPHEEAPVGRHHARGIMEKESCRRNHDEGLWRRTHRGEIMEAPGSIWEAA